MKPVATRVLRKAQSNNSTGVLWVTFDETKDQYRVRIQRHGRRKHVGWFDSLEDAREAAAHHHADLNQPVTA